MDVFIVFKIKEIRMHSNFGKNQKVSPLICIQRYFTFELGCYVA